MKNLYVDVCFSLVKNDAFFVQLKLGTALNKLHVYSDNSFLQDSSTTAERGQSVRLLSITRTVNVSLMKNKTESKEASLEQLRHFGQI